MSWVSVFVEELVTIIHLFCIDIKVGFSWLKYFKDQRFSQVPLKFFIHMYNAQRSSKFLKDPAQNDCYNPTKALLKASCKNPQGYSERFFSSNQLQDSSKSFILIYFNISGKTKHLNVMNGNLKRTNFVEPLMLLLQGRNAMNHPWSKL